LKKLSTQEIIQMPIELLEVLHQKLDDEADDLNTHRNLTLKEAALLKELKTKRLFIKRWIDNHSER